jgi:hypothetical protein
MFVRSFASALPRLASLAVRPVFVVGLMLTAMSVTTGCNTKTIPGTSIEDNDTNRAILAVVEKYRLAMENRDIDTLVALASPEYYDTRGTASDPSDDYNYDGLRKFLEDRFKKLETLRVDISLIAIKVDDSDKTEKALVDYRFQSRYQMDLPAGQKWASNDERARLTLARGPDGWKILKGM